MSNTMTHRQSELLLNRLDALSQADAAASARRPARHRKESLRVTRDGMIAFTPHPRALGSALTHPALTTDYSEALIELITPAERDAALTLERLDDLHRYVYASLGDEILWNDSMPGLLPADDQIPIANYGTSNIGRLKTVYRRGLAYRYGRTMQCIAGIHYNYSLHEEVWRRLHADEESTATLVDYQSERYLAQIRNFRRRSWLLMYLFGASPVLDTKFLRGKPHKLDTFDADTLYRPYATSLRMSDLGYSNTTAQAALHVDYNTLPGYLDALSKAVSEPYPAYEAIGTHRDGEWIQINTNVLQIENEFYSTIRPKRVTYSGERPLHALASRGVQYIEVRCLDIDPFEPTGIALETARFIDAFLLACALDEAGARLPRVQGGERELRQRDDGRAQAGLTLQRDGQPVTLQAWADDLMADIETVGRRLDEIRGGDEHARAIAAQREARRSGAHAVRARAAHDARARPVVPRVRAGAERSACRAFPCASAVGGDAAHRAGACREIAGRAGRLEAKEAGSFDAFVAAYRAYTLNRFSV